MLTPELIGPPNHPYLGWLYGGLFKENHRADGSSHSIGIDVGCLRSLLRGGTGEAEFSPADALATARGVEHR